MIYIVFYKYYFDVISFLYYMIQSCGVFVITLERKRNEPVRRVYYLHVPQSPQERAIIVAATAIRDQPMLPATVGVQKSTVRQSALIRQVGLVRIATAGVVEHFLTTVRVNRTVAKRTSITKKM